MTNILVPHKLDLTYTFLEQNKHKVVKKGLAKLYMFTHGAEYHKIMAQSWHLKTNVVAPVRQYLACDAYFSGLHWKL